ncbi:MAG: UvrD-helicase domain-containing protein [Leptospira sp.]|nr:UvrD-helicase domain-containing protein [Leptospira sp.]
MSGSERPFKLQHSFIEASAGTGKTHTIMEIVGDLIQYHKVPIAEILILTYTEKAAGDLKERLRRKLTDMGLAKELRNLDQVSISTIHGFCNLILREYPVETETAENWKLTDADERARSALYQLHHTKWMELVDPEILENCIGASEYFQNIEKIIYAATQLISGKNFPYVADESPFNDKNFLQKTALIIRDMVEKDFKSSEYLSYDQMILTVRDALRKVKNTKLKTAIQSRYKVGILDEFQDTDAAQYDIFSNLFLESGDPGRALYLIGDPKQSIYGFRGADIGTYLKAKKEFTDKGARFIRLEENFRSVEELIHGYNKIISGFFPIEEIEEKILYHEVKPPEEASRKIFKSAKDNMGSIHCVRLSEKELNVADARNLWAKSIAFEAEKLLKSDSKLEYIHSTNGSREIKTIQPRDIAVLVNNKANGEMAGQALREKGIPFTLYKQKGIYLSAEATQIKNILECLLDPNKPSSYRKLLLGDLFQIHPKSLNAFNEHSIDSYEKTTLDRWKALTRDRKFAELFRSIEEDSRIFLTESDTDISWERKRTNYRQVFRKLLQFQITTQAGLQEILEELNRLRQEKTNEEELPLFEKETEKDAVQILTLHASKGLEWPIVFLFHLRGFSSNLKNYSYCTKENGERAYRLDLWDENKVAYSAHTEKEDKRLFYVGITRPKLRLYLPLFRPGSRSASPYSKIFLPALEKALSSSDKTFVSVKIPEANSRDKMEPSKIVPGTVKQIPLIFPESDNPKTIRLHSYSSLKSMDNPGVSIHALTGENHTSIRSDDEAKTEQAQIDKLPSSADTGSYLHKLLEELDFSLFDTKKPVEILKNEKISDLMEYHLNFFGIPRKTQTDPEQESATKNIHSLKERTSEILWESLHAIIPLKGQSSLRLIDISLENRIPEMDFHLFINQDLKVKDPGTFLKGSIDLVFFAGEKYYIADYKSNLLDDYHSEALIESIHDPENRYDLQRNIYALILFEYLKKLFGEKEALEKLGGVYYFFLRGMRDGESSGIYSDLDWNRERLDNVRLEVERLMQVNRKDVS